MNCVTCKCECSEIKGTNKKKCPKCGQVYKYAGTYEKIGRVNDYE